MTSNAQHIISQMVEKLVAEYQPEKIILFGSYATGNPTKDSDIDLLIVKKTRSRFLKRWCDAQKIVNSLRSCYEVDTVVFSPSEIKKRISTGDPFISQVISEGAVLYEC
jgi:uncharacterized protein